MASMWKIAETLKVLKRLTFDDYPSDKALMADVKRLRGMWRWRYDPGTEAADASPARPGGGH